MGEEIPELELVERVGRQELGALGELYDRLAPRTFGLLTRILSSREEAESTLEEVFMQLWEEGDSLCLDGGSVAAWSIMTSRQAALERLRQRRQAALPTVPPPEGGQRSKRALTGPRKTKRRSGSGALKIASTVRDAPMRAGTPAPAGSAATVRVLNPWLPRPAEIALIENRLNLLHKVVHQLPESQRQALELALFRGLSELEIAAELGEPLGKVRTGLRAAVTFVKHRRLIILGQWAANI